MAQRLKFIIEGVLFVTVLVVNRVLLLTPESFKSLPTKVNSAASSCEGKYINSTLLNLRKSTEKRARHLSHYIVLKIIGQIAKRHRNTEKQILKVHKEFQQHYKLVREESQRIKIFTIISFMTLVAILFQNFMMIKSYDKIYTKRDVKKNLTDENIQTILPTEKESEDVFPCNKEMQDLSVADREYDSTDDENDDPVLTAVQKKKLSRLFSQHEWIRVWQFFPEFLEVHVDTTIPLKDASDQLSDAFQDLKLPHLNKHLRLIQIDDAKFRFTSDGPRPGQTIQGHSEGRSEQCKVCVGAFVDVKEKGIHVLSAGHGIIQKGWQTEFEDEEETKKLGPCIAHCFSVQPKSCDVILVKVENDTIKGQNVVNMNLGRETGLKMHSGLISELFDKQCLKYEDSQNSLKGTVTSLEFYFRDRVGSTKMQFNKCISVANKDNEKIPFSTDSECGKLVVVEPEADNPEKAVVLGIIFGVHEETIHGKPIYRTCITPIWRAITYLKCKLGKEIIIK